MVLCALCGINGAHARCADLNIAEDSEVADFKCQVSCCDWWIRGHVTSILLSDWWRNGSQY